MIYAGSFSEARISVKGYELGVPTKSVALELDPFDLNLPESVMSRTVSTTQPRSRRLQVNLSKATSLRLSRAGFAAPPQSDELTQYQILLILSGQPQWGCRSVTNVLPSCHKLPWSGQTLEGLLELEERLAHLRIPQEPDPRLGS